MNLPTKEELLHKLLRILDEDDTTDEEALSALKTLNKYDKILATKKALEMYEMNIKRVPVMDILLSLLPEEKKTVMDVIPKDLWSNG